MSWNATAAKLRRAGSAAPNEQSLPPISPRLLQLFGKYSAAYLRRHFHSVRLLQAGPPHPCAGLPLVLYLNHAAWWDPLVALLLARRFFAPRASFAPIEAHALDRYRFLRRLGFFAVENGSRAGAAQFLELAARVLASPTNALWITPQGKFTDPRARPLQFQRGLSHLASRVERAAFLPVAVEYAHWEERLPEVLISFGEPLIFDAHRHLGIAETTRLFELALASVQDQLAAASQRREPSEWRILLQGGAGIGGLYDLWRRARAKFRGEDFDAAHSNL